MTVPHTSGTITLVKGSAVINGTDTAWQAALIVGGVIFVNVPNSGGLALPILTVDSNTAITAAMPWQGASGTYSYTLIRDGAYERQSTENAVKLGALLSQMSNAVFSAFAGLAPTADKIPFFGPGGAGALADFNAAARTLLAGGVLPNAQLPARLVDNLITNANTFTEYGRARGNNATGAPTNNGDGDWYTYENHIGSGWGYQIATAFFDERRFIRWFRSSVFQPWKSLSDSKGSNANGDYVRISDGTQICWSRRPMTGNFQSRTWSTWTYPAGFVTGQIPMVSHNPNLNSIVDGGNEINTATSLYVPSNTDVTPTSVTMQITSGRTLLNWQQVNTYAIAIGRWY